MSPRFPDTCVRGAACCACGLQPLDRSDHPRQLIGLESSYTGRWQLVAHGVKSGCRREASVLGEEPRGGVESGHDRPQRRRSPIFPQSRYCYCAPGARDVDFLHQMPIFRREHAVSRIEKPPRAAVTLLPQSPRIVKKLAPSDLISRMAFRTFSLLTLWALSSEELWVVWVLILGYSSQSLMAAGCLILAAGRRA